MPSSARPFQREKEKRRERKWTNDNNLNKERRRKKRGKKKKKKKEKPLFKPFKVSKKEKQKIRELRRHKALTEGVGDNSSELSNKLDSLLRVIPETPQPSEEISKMKTRSTSKLINVINEDSDQNSENTTEISSISEKDINPINSKHWKMPSKLYFQRPTAPNLLLDEKGKCNFRREMLQENFWNIWGKCKCNYCYTLLIRFSTNSLSESTR